jgi:glucosylceramidase
MRRLRILISACVLLCLSVSGAVLAATGPTVSSWTTAADRSYLLTPGPSQVFGGSANPPGAKIEIDTAQVFQTMDGFGASITDSSASLLYRLPVDQRNAVMNAIFHPVDGIGLSILRQPIGASDFVDGPHYTYNDLPEGQTDFNMTRFSIAHDEARILPLLRQALQLNPGLKVMATPWSPPAWMKTNNSLVGGRLKSDAATVEAYALYLLKFVQAYQAAGVPLFALTVQNEPQNRTPDAYPGTDMPVASEAAVISALGPMLRNAGLGSVKIIAYDHNWTEHPDDVKNANDLGVPAEPNYPYDILRSSAAPWIAGTAYHCYSGDASAQTALHDAFPGKDIWFTECSGFHGTNDAFTQYFSDTLKFHAKNVFVGATRNWARSVINWNLALDARGRPANGGCGNSASGNCTGVLTIDGATVTRNAEYYMLGHFSKFVKPGAVRVASNNAGDLSSVAFRNPDAGLALFVFNSGGAAQTFNIAWNGMSVGYVLPPNAMTTFTWPAANDGGGGDTTPPTAPGGLAASATSSTSTNLGWSAASDNVGVVGYNIYRNAVQIGTSTTTSFTSTGLSPATTYAYSVSAKDAAGNVSAASPGLSVTTLASNAADTTPPSAPSNLLAAATTATSVSLGWGASTDDVGVTGYVVYRNGAQIGTTGSASFTDSGVRAASSYSYTVKARDAAGNLSASSAAIRVTTLPDTSAGGQWYQVVNRNSGKCLDVTDLKTSDGTVLQQWGCNTPLADNQVWKFVPTGDGYFHVVSRLAPNLAWDITGGPGATGDGVPAQLWTYVGAANQQWKSESVGYGYVRFVARHSGKCLDVRDVSSNNGAVLQQWTCTGGPAQSFRLTLTGR